MTFLVSEEIHVFAVKFTPLALAMKKFPERIIPTVGPNLMNYFNVELQKCRFFFILEQESACFSALIASSLWKDKIDWLKMESKSNASETCIMKMKNREPKSDLVNQPGMEWGRTSKIKW